MEGVLRSDVKLVESPRRVRTCDFLLRILGLAFTFVAAVMVGANKETKIISITIAHGLPPFHLTVTAKWQYMSAFVYLLVSNAIACSYAAGSLLYSMAARNNRNTTTILLILDLVIMGLLFSANGAAAAVGMIGRDGNSHLQWRKVCDVFGVFCNHGAAAIILSLLGSFAFLWLVVHAVLTLHNKSK